MPELPVFLGLAAFVLLGLGACELLKPTIDRSKAEGLIKVILPREKIEPTSITCPDKEPVEKGRVLECTAVVNGVEVHFGIEQMDDQGTVVATPRDHTLVVATVEPEIKADLQATGHEVASIDCHGDELRFAAA